MATSWLESMRSRRARELLAEVGSVSDRDACEVLALAADLALSDSGEAQERRARAQAFLERRLADTQSEWPDEIRLSLRILRRVIERERVTPMRASRPEPVLQVGPRASWFLPPGGERVDLSRRGPLRRLLLALVECRESAPGHGLSVTELASAAWPDVGHGARGLSARVYVGVGTLRRLGLGDLLERGEAGYRLDPSIQLLRPE